MNRILSLLLIAPAALMAACADRASPTAEHGMAAPEAEAPSGPHDGRLLESGDFSLELAIFEAGVPPEYHAWAALGGEPLEPREVDLRVELARLGGTVDTIEFAPTGDYLRGRSTVHEPHSFDVHVRAVHAGRTHEWRYASYEGRTTIAPEVAAAAGIGTAVAGPATIAETTVLYGTIAPDVARVREVTARFPGVIRSVRARIGDAVNAGDALATIESNESLQSYTLTAPLAGVVTQRHAEPGARAGDDALFVIADLSTVWAELGVFPRDRARVQAGQRVALVADGGASEVPGTIGYLAPLADRASQRVTARVVLDNRDRGWTPGQFVGARVTLAETPVELAVPLAALQTFREFDVVFAQVGDTYEVRMLELGRRDARNVEVLDGLAPGTVFVTDGSYLVKADIEKSGASHDH
jgi:cobalt-zinc-cadmium efflux system membrane fusion protein